MQLIYRYCNECGWSVRKKTYKGEICPRCGGSGFWEEDIPSSELSIVDDVAEEFAIELLEEKGFLKPKKK